MSAQGRPYPFTCKINGVGGAKDLATLYEIASEAISILTESGNKGPDGT